MKFSKIGLLLICFFSLQAKARLYNRYLNSENIENVMAGLASRSPLTGNEWLSTVGSKKNDTYTIVSGDSLWKIAKKIFGNPFLWRKLWEVNQNITNPHDLEVGKILYYYHSPVRGLASTIPVIKLLPDNKSAVSDLDKDSFINSSINQEFKLKAVPLSDFEIVGEITGSHSASKNLKTVDDIYLTFKEGKLPQIGDLFSVVTEFKAEKSLPNFPEGGKLMQVLGKIKVIEQTSDALFKGEILSEVRPIERGNKLTPYLQPIVLLPPITPPDDLRIKILLSDEPGRHFFTQGEMVILSGGEDQGVKNGYLFRVAREDDPYLKKTSVVSPKSFGEIEIVHTGKVSSIGYIIRNDEPLVVDDILVSYTLFSNPPPPPKRDVEVIGID